MKDRLLELIKCLNVSNKAEFARQMGWKPQYLNNILSGNSIGLSPIISLLTNYPNLNARWLLLGEGEMWLDNDIFKIHDNLKGVVECKSKLDLGNELNNDALNKVVNEDIYEEYTPSISADVNLHNVTLDNGFEDDLRTPVEKERDAFHFQVRKRYLELVAQYPQVKPYRLITAVANQFKRSVPNVRAILISQGVYHKSR